MPQMAPLNWLTLMIMFIMTLLMYNIMNYYSFKYTITPKSLKSMKKYTINWKW